MLPLHHRSILLYLFHSTVAFFAKPVNGIFMQTLLIHVL